MSIQQPKLPLELLLEVGSWMQLSESTAHRGLAFQICKGIRRHVQRAPISCKIRRGSDITDLLETVERSEELFLGITYGPIFLLETAIPVDIDLLKRLEQLLQKLGKNLTELNVAFKVNTGCSIVDFLVLSHWAPMLPGIRALRIKQDAEVTLQFLRDQMLRSPWFPCITWPTCVARFKRLRSVYISTHLPAGPIDDATLSEMDWVSDWASGLSELKVVYLHHAQDRELEIEDVWYDGILNRYVRKEGTWIWDFQWDYNKDGRPPPVDPEDVDVFE